MAYGTYNRDGGMLVMTTRRLTGTGGGEKEKHHVEEGKDAVNLAVYLQWRVEWACMCIHRN